MLLLSDVTIQKEKEKMLVDLHKASEMLLQQKKQFLAVISHELRTPISGIVGMIELLEQRKHDNIESKMLRNALTSANKLKLLVDDILDFSKLDAEQLRITLEDTNVSIDLCEVIKSFENLALRKGLMFKVDWEPSPYLNYHVDILRISQVISNVLSNAIKFTDNGLITIKIKTLPDRLIFSITDTGIGMTPEEQRVLFDPFIQAQDSIARKYGGTGLGMAIVKNLIELMNGTISVKSQPEVGTTVEIIIFADSRHVTIPQIKEVLETNDQKLALWFKALSIDYLLTKSETYTNKKNNCYPSKVFELLEKQSVKSNDHVKVNTQLTGHVLVVEDDPLNRHVFKMQLDSLNLSSSLVNSGIEAIQFISNNSIDVIISDYHMPGMNGFEFATHIRTSKESYAQTPIIICTADNSEEVKTHASKIGINSILYKPYSITDLTEQLNGLLSYSDNDNLSNSPNLKSWFQKFEHGNQTLMAQAIIESLSTGVTALKDENQCTKSAAHRLKGAVGALELHDIAFLCSQLESTPDNINIKNQLLNQIESLISEAKKIM
ncbi:hybrid sensor histidine kinase/response regulator [Photobacterium leiognathi]|nr:ATP-binding protein [Photobacterium leiognathi]